MKIYKIFALLICTLISFSGCETQKPDEDSAFDNLIVVGFSQVGAESDWRKANTENMKSELSENNGFRLIFDDAQQKQERQINAIRSFIQQDVDYIILAPTTEVGWDTVLKEAEVAGIPVIIIDRKIEVEDDSLFACWIGSDFKKEGGKAVEWLAENFGTDPVRIVHLQGSLGSSAQIGRTEALDEGIAANPNWSLVARDSGEFTQAKAQELMRQYTSLNFNVIYSENDNMSYGAIDVLKENGITPGKDIAIVSFDAARRGLELTLAGEISINVECNPLIGRLVAMVIRQLEAGETPTKFTIVPDNSFTAKTLSQAIIDERGY